MCGIAGILVGSSSFEENYFHSSLKAMQDSIDHRGPDSRGIWISDDKQVFVSHNRLAIQELSHHGHQPMISSCKRYVLSFNGEIFNHLEIRQKLKNSGLRNSWKGNCDTETLVELIAAFGIKQALKDINGQFAFMIYDRSSKTVCLCRDRFGEKPLYYSFHNKNLIFSSQIKSFLAIKNFKRNIDISAVKEFTKLGYVPKKQSILKDVFKVLPGEVIKINLKEKEFRLSNYFYWDFEEEMLASKKTQFKSFEEATEQVHSKFEKSVKRQLISDVPLGAFLSGGIDSSLVVALMQANSSGSTKTFSIGFEDQNYDESKFARKIAEYLSTDHNEYILSESDVIDSIPLLSSIYDEPFGDSSQIPTSLISQLARKQVTVALTGDGGDELFMGYERYKWLPRIWKIKQILPHRFLHAMLNVFLTKQENFGFLQRSLFASRPNEKISKVQKILSANTQDGLFFTLLNNIPPKVDIFNKDFLNHEADIETNQEKFLFSDELNFLESINLHDLKNYLSGDILTKVDRASMYYSLECRTPFLDVELFNSSLRTPNKYKLYNGTGKYILRNILKEYLPLHLFERPKMGFSLPISTWLNTSLKEWASDLLSEEKINESGIYNPIAIQQLWNSHINSSENFELIWSVLMFQDWFYKYK